MANAECPENARRLGSLLIFIGGAFVAIAALTQAVGVNLGALVFIVMSMIWPAQAIRRCENWGRIGYLISGPLALWMGLQALGDAEFFQGILYLFIIASFIVYLVALVLLLSSKTKKAFLNATTQSEGRSADRGFGVLLIGLAGFLFAWWWTNLSTALHLIGTRDFQGIFISLGGISIAVAFGVLFLRVWWSTSWSTVASWILLATGGVLLVHALCYSAITALVYIGGRESGKIGDGFIF